MVRRPDPEGMTRAPEPPSESWVDEGGGVAVATEGGGRDGAEGADAARELFERIRVVRLGEDEDGRPMPPSPEQFAEARRVYQETEAALDLPDDEDPR